MAAAVKHHCHEAAALIAVAGIKPRPVGANPRSCCGTAPICWVRIRG